MNIPTLTKIGNIKSSLSRRFTDYYLKYGENLNIMM